MQVILEIFEITGKYALTEEQGQEVYDRIQAAVLQGNDVRLNFRGVRIFSSLFFSYAIGQLLRTHPSEVLNARVQITDLVGHGGTLLETVISNAKRHYSDLAGGTIKP